MEDAYAWVCLRSAVFSEAFGLRNRCYSKISVVVLLGYSIAGILRKLESERQKICPAPKCCMSDFHEIHMVSTHS